jgi:hypothetical protein
MESSAMRKAMVAAALLWLAGIAPAIADCSWRHGEKVVLYGTTDDPSVLIWDSRARLRSYFAASFDEAQAMLPHAILVGPGTHAEIQSCVPNYVESPIFHSPDDALGVLITSGSKRGLIRWVLGSDVRPYHH